MDSYLIQFVNVQSDNIVCTITDTESATDYIYELTGAGIILRNTNSDEDKFSPLRPMEAEISFINTQSINLDTFSGGGEDRFLVSIAAGSDYLFKGYLQQDDIEEAFQPQGYNVVRLIASDGIGRLKGVKLNETPNGELDGVYTLAKYIAYALSPLGLDLDINIVNNLYEEDHEDRDIADSKCAFNQTFLDIRTFKNSDEFEDCYTVLEKILGYNYFLTQHEHKWWVVRVDEYVRNYPFSYTTYDYTGTISGATLNDKQFTGDQFFLENTIINKTDLEFINEDAVYQKVRPAKSIKLVFDLEQYGEVPCNNNFKRGTLENDLVTYKKYTIEDWEEGKFGASLFDALATSSGDSYTRANIDSLGRETERFAVVEINNTADDACIRSCEIPAYAGDKLEINFEYAFAGNIGLTGTQAVPVAIVTLLGDDTTEWTLSYGVGSSMDIGVWLNSELGSVNDYYDTDGVDQSEKRTVSFSTGEIPVTGTIRFHYINTNIGSYSQPMYFYELKLEYNIGQPTLYMPVTRPTRPRRFGYSYTSAKSQFNKVSDTSTSFKQLEEQIFVSDSPRKYFKGSLLKLDGSNYVLTNSWSNYFDYATGAQAPPVVALGTYGKFQAFAVWNQNNYYQKKFRFTMSGLKRTPAVESTATSGSSTTLTDTTQGWTVNQYAGYILYFTDGTSAPNSMVIISNTSDTLTFASTNAPDNTTEYKIELHPYISQLHRMQVNTIGASHYFMFTDLERDLYLAEIRGTIIEVRDSNLSYEVGDYDTHEFGYIL